MEKQTPMLNQKSTVWKTFWGFSVVVFFFFWVGALTDYSWYDNWLSILYSVIVLCVSVVVFAMSFSLGGLQRILIMLVCLLSFPLAPANIPLHRYHLHQIPIQVVVSPDGTRFVEVYCEFTNAHVNGFDHIEIIVRSANTPFFQRDLGLYNNYNPRHCIGYSDDLIHWNDNNTIYVVERQAYLAVDNIKWDGLITSPGEINSD